MNRGAWFAEVCQKPNSAGFKAQCAEAEQESRRTPLQRSWALEKDFGLALQSQAQGVHWVWAIPGDENGESGADKAFEEEENGTVATASKRRENVCIGRELNPGLPRGRREFYH